MRVATDAGGTFTDLVGLDEKSGAIVVGKALTTPRDPSLGVLDAIAQAAAGGGLSAEAVGFFVHGGTTVINAITERKGVATALVTTRGFRDVIAIGRGNRPDLYNLQAQPAEPFVPRRLRFEVTERIDAGGRVRTPLSLDDLAAVAGRIADAGVDAVAVVFLHAYAAPAHEAAAAAFLRERLPGVSVTASHEVSRRWREYERSNTAVLSAYVQPIMARYLANLDAALSGAGLACPRYCMQSNGGLAGFAAAEAAPLTLVESGPAGGVAGAVRVGEAIGEPDVLYLDVGGTTAKCSLVRDGRPVLTPDYRLEWTRLDPGYPVQVPVVDIVEIGAGGGSVAWIDPSGSVRVGPASAGADPGPACYGRGGTRPTVTDAKLLTGVIDPQRFAGGRLTLDAGRAAVAMAPIAEHLGVTTVAAAHAVIRLAEAGMINALKLVTVQRGHDPRDLALIVSGGGGPMHAATLARELGVKHVVIPRYAGLFSAWGMLAARPRLDLSRTRFHALSGETPALARALFAELEAEAAMRFGVARDGWREHVPPGSERPGRQDHAPACEAGAISPRPDDAIRSESALAFTRKIEMRYAGQEHTVGAPFDPDAADVESLVEAFHAAHERAYTFRLPDAGIELVTFHLTAELDAPRVELPEIRVASTAAAARRGDREVHLADHAASVRAAVYDRDGLPAGAELAGPALVEEDTSTTLVLPGQRLRVDARGLMSIEEA